MRVLCRGRITYITTDGRVFAITAPYGQVGPIDTIGVAVEGSAALIAAVDDTGDLVAICDTPPPHTHDTTPRWNDLRVALSSGKPNTSPPTFAAFRSGTEAWAFAPNATEQICFEAQLPHGWAIGTEIRPHIHWSPGNSTNTGSVVWQLEYSWANPGSAFPASTTLTATQAAAGVAYQHQIAGFGAVDGAGKHESSVLLCRLARVGGNPADTFTGSAFGISVDIHYLAAALGSVAEMGDA